MPTDESSTEDEAQLKTHSFRADEDQVEYLDWLIDQKNAKLPPGSDDKISRSDVLRECIGEVIDDFEEELELGNQTAGRVAIAD